MHESGYLDEAYQLAIDQGAHFIECDVVLTKDCHMICRHEPNLNETTDAFQKVPHLQRTYMIDGNAVSGILSVDLTLAEVKSLRAVQPRAFRDQSHNGLYHVPTLQEYIDIAKAAQRTVGIYPETKHPTWFDSRRLACMKGQSMGQMVLDVLLANGYGAALDSEEWRQQPAFIQSFEVNNLKALHAVTNIPLVQLLEVEALRTADTQQAVAELMSDEGLREIATYAAAIGPSKTSILPVDAATKRIGRPTDLVARAHAKGLLVHPYTFRDDSIYLAPDWRGNPQDELAFFFNNQTLDGAFDDFPGTLASFLAQQTQARLQPLSPGPCDDWWGQRSDGQACWLFPRVRGVAAAVAGAVGRLHACFRLKRPDMACGRRRWILGVGFGGALRTLPQQQKLQPRVHTDGLASQALDLQVWLLKIICMLLLAAFCLSIVCSRHRRRQFLRHLPWRRGSRLRKPGVRKPAGLASLAISPGGANSPSTNGGSSSGSEHGDVEHTHANGAKLQKPSRKPQVTVQKSKAKPGKKALSPRQARQTGGSINIHATDIACSHAHQSPASLGFVTPSKPAVDPSSRTTTPTAPASASLYMPFSSGAPALTTSLGLSPSSMHSGGMYSSGSVHGSPAYSSTMHIPAYQTPALTTDIYQPMYNSAEMGHELRPLSRSSQTSTASAPGCFSSQQPSLGLPSLAASSAGSAAAAQQEASLAPPTFAAFTGGYAGGFDSIWSMAGDTAKVARTGASDPWASGAASVWSAGSSKSSSQEAFNSADSPQAGTSSSQGRGIKSPVARTISW
ncbi:hypothetical protein WJX72_009370 [[Myrmecia] bisecta]|uniref:glycerophosphodiester phosphodiesterase n=1 Tax=[Myrmecia] bisecta TaxID=41462 RepID=A0AAW1P796_9CHLO